MKKIRRKLGKFLGTRSRTPNDPAPLDPKEQAALARDEKSYGVDDLTTLDGPGLMKALMIYRAHPIYAQLTTLWRNYSMMHTDLLTVLYYLARHAPGNLIEIGPYLGGSTMATALGLRASGRAGRFVTVEMGGAGRHPRLASADIVRDLKQNLADNSLADLVQVVVGYSLEKQTAERVAQELPERSVGLFTIDADGEVRAVLDRYEPLLRDECWVVIDDYFAVGEALEKSARTKPQVEAAVAAGELEELGYYGWGTWVGRWHRRGAAART